MENWDETEISRINQGSREQELIVHSNTASLIIKYVTTKLNVTWIFMRHDTHFKPTLPTQQHPKLLKVKDLKFGKGYTIE